MNSIRNITRNPDPQRTIRLPRFVDEHPNLLMGRQPETQEKPFISSLQKVKRRIDLPRK